VRNFQEESIMMAELPGYKNPTFRRYVFMQASLTESTNELSWTDLLLECIEIGITPSEVQAFLSQSTTVANQG
jgi:hypothetical protein